MSSISILFKVNVKVTKEPRVEHNEFIQHNGQRKII